MKYFPTLLLIDYVATILLGIFLAHMMSGSVSPDAYLSLRSFLSQVIVMPFLESVIFQLLVIEAVMRILPSKGNSISLAVACSVSAILFFLAHYYLNSKFNGLVFGISGGIIFALMYGANRDSGVQKAFFWTWILHLSSNAIFMASYAFFLKSM